MRDKLLELEVRLLMLRYGRRPVLDALATISEQSVEQLEQQLKAMEDGVRSKRKRPSKPTLMEVAMVESEGRPEIANLLRVIATKFENRAFLPNLRDVERFLYRIEQPRSSRRAFKSRTAAGLALIRALAKLPQEEVHRLADTAPSAGESDYSILSRAIMGKRPDPAEND